MHRIVFRGLAAFLTLSIVTLGCGASDSSMQGEDGGGGDGAPGVDGAAGFDATSDLDAAQHDDVVSQSDSSSGSDSSSDAEGGPSMTLALRAGALGGQGNVDGTGAGARFSYESSLAINAAGTLFVADRNNQIIREVTAAGVVTTFAGSANLANYADGTGSAARFNAPSSMVFDAAGNAFVADMYNVSIRKVTPAGVVSTLAGGNYGAADGVGPAAQFTWPTGIAIDSAGNLFVADNQASTIRKVTPLGVVTTLAGTAYATGSTDGTGSAARFNFPNGLAVDAAGNVIVADTSNNTIRKITPAGVVSTIAGTAGSPGSANGTGAAARFSYPDGVATDAAGNVWVADTSNYTIRKISAGAVVTTFAGFAGAQGTTDSTGVDARFFLPSSVVLDGAGNLFVSDAGNTTVRKITTAAVVTTFVGSIPHAGYVDDVSASARFTQPAGTAMDASGNIYVADYNNCVLRKINAAGVVTTIAGREGACEALDGTGINAHVYCPYGLVLNGAGDLVFADSFSSTIRKSTTAGVVTTIAGLASVTGTADGTGTAARFTVPRALALDSVGNIFVADTNSSTIRKITAGGVVTTFAGSGGMQGTADGVGAAARFTIPYGIAIDGSDNVYVADTYGDTIRKITPAGVVTTLAGMAYAAGSADGTGALARFNRPNALAADAAGNLYVADSGNYLVRKITPAGVVTTIAGVANRAIVQPGPLPASLNSMDGITLLANGNLIVTAENSLLDVILH